VPLVPVEGPELGRTLAMRVVGPEDGSTSLSLSTNNASHLKYVSRAKGG
jgi:hypothetical protein